MSKHSPGPWRVDGRKVMAMKEKQVCEVPCYGVVHGKVDIVNAHLIAAAPDLLAALTECLDNTGGGWIAAAVIERARAAIALAQPK